MMPARHTWSRRQAEDMRDCLLCLLSQFHALVFVFVFYLLQILHMSASNNQTRYIKWDVHIRSKYGVFE
jgi:hypothetical protein